MTAGGEPPRGEWGPRRGSVSRAGEITTPEVEEVLVGIMLAGEVTMRVEEVVQPPGVARLYAKRTFSPKYTFLSTVL